MTVARAQIIDSSVSRYYHCISRCVRHSYLCGEDRVSGKNFNHRKSWLVERMKFLASLFSVKVAAYAILSNHYHLIIYWDIEQGEKWCDDDVIRRWCQLYNNSLGLAYLNGESLSPEQLQTLKEMIVVWKNRLMDISWFMRCLNENIAKRANQEDGCSGHFWKNRFRAQALLDDAAVLCCMAYVDLNPIRAGICERLEDADFTSIQERLHHYQSSHCDGCDTSSAAGLMEFTPAERQSQGNVSSIQSSSASTIPYLLLDYFDLVDWTGRCIREDKRGFIPEHVPPMLQQLGLPSDIWVRQMRRFHTVRALKYSFSDKLAAERKVALNQ